MEVRLKLGYPLSKVVGKREIPFHNVKGDSLSLLERLCRDCPNLRKEIFDSAGNLQDHLILFINQRPAVSEEALGKRLKDGDLLHLLVAVAGG